MKRSKKSEEAKISPKVIAGVVGVIVILIFLYNETLGLPVSPSYTISQNNATQSAGAKTDMSDWKIYTNQAFGFTVKYPDSENALTPFEVEKNIRINWCRGGTDACLFMVERFKSTTIDDQYKKDASGPAFVSATKLSNFVSSDYTFQTATISYVDQDRERYYIAHRGDLYVVSFNSNNPQPEIKNKILSTFQFTN